MVGNSYEIEVAEGGFIVDIEKASDEEADNVMYGRATTRRVFADSAALLNFLHNELVGSN